MIEKMYYVKWVDSGFSLLGDVWQSREEINEILKESKVVETVGFHCGETEDWLILGQSMNQNLIRGGYFIYKKNILEIKELLKESEV
jgi:metal-dependent hydrolase (beta-lactamase superfamily II)